MNLQLFPSYTDYSPAIPVVCLTPKHGKTIHRFFDSSPISPDGRFLAALTLPQEERNPLPGEKAAVLLVDLETGEEREVDTTAGWGVQVGANVQWSPDGRLYYNDVREGHAVLVRFDPRTESRSELGNAGIFMLSPDGRYALTHNLGKSRLTQPGYGVMLEDSCVTENGAFPEDDGFYRTDTESGKTELFMPLSRLIEAGIENRADFAGGAFYGFQCKYSPDGSRLMYVVRWLSGASREVRPMVFTSDADGENIRLALHWREWQKGGHHVNWHPDNEHITMNLRYQSDCLRFVSFRYDGSGLHTIFGELVGSGHPSFSPDGKLLLTDAYTHDACAYGDGTTPIRLIDTESGSERVLIRLRTDTNRQDFLPDGTKDTSLRLDPHPVWCCGGRLIVFNGFCDGTRRVYAGIL